MSSYSSIIVAARTPSVKRLLRSAAVCRCPPPHPNPFSRPPTCSLFPGHARLGEAIGLALDLCRGGQRELLVGGLDDPAGRHCRDARRGQRGSRRGGVGGGGRSTGRGAATWLDLTRPTCRARHRCGVPGPASTRSSNMMLFQEDDRG